jgi:methionyl-tRNA formyltransferase
VNCRILFVTQDDPFYVRIFFEEFFARFRPLQGIKGVVITRPLSKKRMTDLARQMYGFYGFRDFARVGLRYCGYRTLARLLPPAVTGSRSYGLVPLCRRWGIEVTHEHDVNGEAFLRKLNEMDLDLVISVAASAIFKRDLLELPRLGCINIHSGKLPKYRGMMPVFWQLVHGEKEVGITIHEMNLELDDGRIILQRDMEVAAHETLHEVMTRSKRVGAHLMMEAIDLICSGRATYRANPKEEGSYFSFPRREDVREFKRSGRRIM